MASESSSESEFEGFDEEDVLLATQKENNVKKLVQEAIDDINESDIDFSDSESDSESEDSGDELSIIGVNDPYLQNLNIEWGSELSDINLPAFTEETGVFIT